MIESSLSIILFSSLFFQTVFRQNIDRSMFGFQICFCQVLTNDSHTEQLNAADHHYDTNHGRPAGGRITKDQGSDNDKYNK